MSGCSRRAFLYHAGAALPALGLRSVFAASPTTDVARSGASGAAAALLDDARALLTRLAVPVLQRFLTEWPHESAQRAVTPQQVPAVRWLADLVQDDAAIGAALVRRLAANAAGLAWRRSYSPALVGERFYENYGYTELAGLLGPVDSERLACGVLIVGPGLVYPPHRHEAEEIYVPLAGRAEWRRGGQPWRSHAAGTVIHHARHESHAMRTADQPLLALYLWRSRNLRQHAELDPAAE
jgi:quercetin dioxygenase-like cupin family protein